MTGVVNPRQSALEVPLCRHHFIRKLLALLELKGDRCKHSPKGWRCRRREELISGAKR